MNTFNKPLFAFAVMLSGILLTTSLVYKPKRVTQDFVDHLSHQRYDEAARMLSVPCSITSSAER